ncbi:MAG TPA: hypothetical protein VMU88_00570 [bacterium]|nr:hypothetical protein [bacterium]
MKKLIAALMTVLFLGSTTGLVLAQTPTTAVTPTAKVMKKHKSHKKMKKAAAAPAASTTPASK